MIRAILGAALTDIAERLGHDAGKVTKDRLVDQLRSALVTASWPGEEYSVRRDLGSAEHAGRGTWRFDLLVERPDRVMAAIEVRAEQDDLDDRVMALARLSLARGRGIAETAFLLEAKPINASSGTGGFAQLGPGLEPLAEAWAGGDGQRWRLALFEPEASQPP